MTHLSVVTNPRPKKEDPDAKRRLIQAGLEIFGLYNLEGATTRQLAERAGTNQAAIPYYFGGKEGLYLAVIQHLFSTNFSLIQPVVVEIRDRLTTGKPSKSEALELLKKLLSTMLELVLTRGASSTWARIVMREQMQPTPAFDTIYEGAIKRVHETVSMLVGMIIGRSSTDPKVILRAHMLVGQVLIFLAGRETIRRRLDLNGYTDKEVREIQEALAEQLDLLRHERGGEEG
jgi:TetR/AcrR family transcriptional regulator, regulator of cefoperazone and chloramphenicol sensitivity